MHGSPTTERTHLPRSALPGDRHERSRTRQHVGDALGVSSTSYSEDQTAPFEPLARSYPERVSGDHAERAHVASTTAKIASVTRPIGGMPSISTSNPLSW